MIIEMYERFNHPDLREGMRVQCLESWFKAIYEVDKIYTLELCPTGQLVVSDEYKDSLGRFNGYTGKWLVLDLANSIPEEEII